MSLASVLVQPQRIVRVQTDPNVRLIDDVTRLVVFLLEDALRDERVARALSDVAIAMGPRLQAEMEQRFRRVADSLRIRAEGVVTALQQLGEEVAGIAEDRSRALAFASRLLTIAKDFVATLTYPGLREKVQLIANLLEQDLGLSAAFVEAQIQALLEDLATRLQALDAGGDAALRRRRRAAASTLRRLGRFLRTNFSFPGFDVDALTRLLYEQTQKARLDEVARQVDCALGDFEAALGSARALGAATSLRGLFPADDARPQPRSVGAAALIDLPGESTYAWYPTWLLSGEDLPLLGFANLKNAAGLIVAVRDGTEAVPVWLRQRFSASQLEALAPVAVGTEPSQEQKLIVLAVLNQALQGSLIYDSERFPGLDLPDELRTFQRDAVTNQAVLEANQRFLLQVFSQHLQGTPTFCRWVARRFDLPVNQVLVSPDRRFVMYGDMPLCMGENLKWNDAPLFSQTEAGQTYWIFEHVNPEWCEGLAQHLAWPTLLGTSVWHLVNIILDQPGHRIGSGIAVGLEFAEALDQLLFGRPVNGHDALGWFGDWLSSGIIGPRGLSLIGGTFEGMHTTTTAGNSFFFWLTVAAGDLIRTLDPNTQLGQIRELVLTTITLVNFGGPRLGPSTLPPHPAQNRKKQDAIESLVNSLFGLWLVSYYQRDDHSIGIWYKGGIGDRRERAFKLWLGGGIGMGLVAGLTTTVVSQTMAWAEDWERFGWNLLKSVGISLAQFWLLEYLSKEGDTDGGKYNPRGAPFKGYPKKDTSPYRLPWPKGQTRYAGQSNLGLFSHNDISNKGSDQQCYAYDFGHDYRQPICAARSGTVWSFSEAIPDNDETDWNSITIRHDVVDPEHDNPFGTGAMTTYAVYGHGAQNGVTAAFASRGLPPPVKGTPVNQGDVIMLADDTGTSFHSHLHMHVLLDSGGAPGTLGIPFVFKEVRGEGRCINLTWYESENG